MSFAPNSKIDRRRLAAALLREGESRGTDASGYAWISDEGDGVYKKALPGSKLHVGNIPTDATAMILHTRASTQGDPKYNENNHPVISPGGTIRLVHNGVIFNDDDIRKVIGKEIAAKMPVVDTAALPAVIEVLGLENTDMLQGDASAAWFDTETGGTIHLAKFSHSPIHFAFLEDGSIAFASTEAILGRALVHLGIKWFGGYPDTFEMVNEGEYFQLLEGEIINEGTVDWDHDWGRYSAFGTAHRLITNGGSSGAKADYSIWGLDDERWDDTPPMALGEDAAGNPTITEAYYTKSHNGDYEFHMSLHSLVANVSWYKSLTGGAGLVEDETDLRWVNYFEDIGELDETSDEISWVKDPGEMVAFGESLPTWIKDGVNVLRHYVHA